MIAAGENVNGINNNGFAALHYAAQNFSIDIAELLLENGADVDVLDAHGNSPLFKAVFNSKGREEMIKLLLKHGANKELPNNHGVSPIQLAKTIANYRIEYLF